MIPRVCALLAALLLAATACPAADDPAPQNESANSQSDSPDKDSSQKSATPRVEPLEDPPTKAEIRESIDRGIAWLLKHQNPGGSWGSARRTKGLNIYAPVPGAHHAFRAAVTALDISALYEVGGDRSDVREARERAEEWLLEHLPKVRRANPTAIYNVWAHAYGIQALVKMHRATDDEARRKQIEKIVRQQFDLLERYESVNGGWGYYDFDIGAKKPASSPTSFTTATVLIALHDAKEIGIEPPQKIVDRGLKAIYRQQKSDLSYLYGEYLKMRPVMGINRPGGSLGRSQACNYALRIWGDEKIDDADYVTWLHRLVARNGWLDIGRKRPIPHESWMQVAGYFYYYGHYYASLCLASLPQEEQPLFQQHLAQLMIDRQEKSGSWFDFPFYDYHEPYGTAFALMTLKRCLPDE